MVVFKQNHPANGTHQLVIEDLTYSWILFVPFFHSVFPFVVAEGRHILTCYSPRCLLFITYLWPKINPSTTIHHHLIYSIEAFHQRSFPLKFMPPAGLGFRTAVVRMHHALSTISGGDPMETRGSKLSKQSKPVPCPSVISDMTIHIHSYPFIHFIHFMLPQKSGVVNWTRACSLFLGWHDR